MPLIGIETYFTTLGKSIDFIAVGVFRYADQHFHLGIVHRNKELNELNLLHLADLHNLINEPCDNNPNFFYTSPRIPPERAQTIAALCRNIAKKNQPTAIMYGFSLPAVDIWGAEGELKLPIESAGLTCSHFILSVFSHSRIDLLKKEEWFPTGEDEIWQQKFYSYLENKIRTIHTTGIITLEEMDNYLKKLASEIGSTRYPPLDVFISSSLPKLPSSKACVDAIKPIFMFFIPVLAST